MPPEGSSHEDEKIERLRRAMYSRDIAPRLSARPRRELEQEKSSVGEDWVRPEPKLSGSTVAPGTIKLTRVLVTLVFVSAAAFFLGAAGFFAYYFLVGGGSTPVSPGNIDIAVSGPLQITSGEPVELQIAIVNRNRTALELADLVVRYPPGTRSPTDLLTDLPAQRTPLGTLEPGGRRQGTVSAVFSGSEGDKASIVVELEYRLEGSSAVFVASTDYQITFASSPLSISVVGNQETIAGQPVELVVTVASNADTPVKDVLFTVGTPFGFTLDTADPEPEQAGSGNVWVLGDLNPGGKKTILLRGTLDGESGDERVFRFTAGTRRDNTEETISVPLADYAHHVTVSRPFLDLNVLVNREETRGTTVVAPGEIVNISVAWQNNLSTPINDAIIVARLAGVDIDGATVRSTDGFYRSTDRTVLWDKTTTNGTLATLAPGTRGTLNFSFQVPNDDVIKALRDPELSITVHAAGTRVSEANVPETLQASAVEDLRFASELDVVAQGLYYSNPFGSTGPIPPKADTETTYAIVFSITNTTNEIRNTRLRATLPPYVRWVGVYSPSNEKLVFNQNDSTMTWEIGTVVPGVGTAGELPRQAAIAIGLTPSTSQIGQQPDLIRDITLTGTDVSTSATVTKTARDVTTNIVGDPGFSSSNAAVVK